MQRDYYEPMNPEQGQAENQSPGSGAGYSGQPGSGQGSSSESMTEQAKEKASEYGEMAREQASKAGATVMEGTETGKDRAADGIHRAASQLRERVGQGDGMKSDVGVKVADQLDRSAQYLQEHEPSEIWRDIEEYVKEHPMQAAVSALAAGFVFGRIMR